MATQWFLSFGLLVEINNGFEVNIARSAAKSGRRERWTSVQALYNKCNEPASEKICGIRLKKPVYWVSFFKKEFPGEERISGFFSFFLSFYKNICRMREKSKYHVAFFVFVFFFFKIHLQEKGEPKYQVSFFIFGYLHEGGKTL